jgi:hypothetical protein
MGQEKLLAIGKRFKKGKIAIHSYYNAPFDWRVQDLPTKKSGFALAAMRQAHENLDHILQCNIDSIVAYLAHEYRLNHMMQ